MRFVRWSATAGVLLALAGCVLVSGKVGRTESLDPKVGYIAATFAPHWRFGFAFGIEDALGHKHVMSFGGRMPGSKTEGTVAIIAVPPGDYRVDYWTTYYLLTRERVTRSAVYGDLSEPFPVKAGQVVYLGNFSADAYSEPGPGSGRTWRLSIDSQAIRADEVVETVMASYPGFASAPVECVQCEPPAAGAVAAARPVAEPAGDFLPEHHVYIHYHRPNGKYAGWGLHVWEVLPDRSRRVLEGVSWQAALQPAGEDDFGVYWMVHDQEFKDGRVNFVVHHIDLREPGGDKALSLQSSHEVWINADDPNVYLTEQAAVDAQD